MNATNLKVSMNVLSEKGYIEVTWQEAEPRQDFLRFDLVRKKASVPAHYFDGKVVYSGTDPRFVDEDIKNGSIYYYRLFVVINNGENYNTDYLTDARCIVKTIAFGANIVSYGDKLYDTLPDQVLEDDKRQDQAYPLKRFFRLIFTEFDKTEVINDTILDQLDVETCDEAILPLHARWLGLEYDYNFDVATNRLLLGTWKEIQPYQGTETGVRYFLQKVFKSEVKITVDKKVNIVIITLEIDDSRYWMINSVDKINKMIKKYLALRTKYDLTIKLGPIIENFDHDRFEEYTFDIIWFTPDDEWYQYQDACLSSDNSLLSYNLFFADNKGNRIKDEIIDLIKMDLDAEDEVYDLDAPLCLGSERFLLSHTLYFAERRVRDMDELIDKFKTENSEKYALPRNNEQTADAIHAYDNERYDRRDVIGNEQHLLSSTLFFADGSESEFRMRDELLPDKAIDTHYDVYDKTKPYLLSDAGSLIGEMQFASLMAETDKLQDAIVETTDEKDNHNRKDDNLDGLSVVEADIYNQTFCFGVGLISETLTFASVERLADEAEDTGITESSDQYLIVMPNLEFCMGLIGTFTFGESTINPPDELVADNVADMFSEQYHKASDELGPTAVQEYIGNETIHSMGLFATPEHLIGLSFKFGRPESVWCDELVDIPHYVRPVGLFNSTDAFVGTSMFMCDNLI